MERNYETLESIIRDDYSICLDTSVFMHQAVSAFMRKLEGELEAANRFIWVPAEVYLELEKHCSSTNSEKAEKARKGMEWLRRLHDKRLIVVCEPSPDGKKFADPVFLSELTRMRTDSKILIFTQDADLATDLQNINQQKSVNGKAIRVMRLKADGSIGRFQQLQQNQEGQSQTLVRGLKTTPIPANALMNDDMVILDTGDCLTGLSGTQYILGKELTGGSEASIYELEGYPSLLAKIFPLASVRKFNKCKLLFDNKVFLPEGAIAPQDLIYDEEGHFAGYVMEKVCGRTFGSLLAAPLRKQYAPEWDRRHFTKLALAFARLTEELLLKTNIVLADISGGNIMIRTDSNGKLKPDDIAIVDLDSAQFGSLQTGLLPAEGRTPDYAAPEELREGFNEDTPRKVAALYYSVALMSLTMLLDIHPFRVCSKIGDEENETNLGNPIADAIAAERFPFGGKETRRTATPPDQIEKVWSNMASATKSFFVDILQKGRPMNAPEDRPNLTRIRILIEGQLKWLLDPKTLTIAPEAYSLNPVALKPYYVTCAKSDCPRNGEPFKWGGKARTDGRYYCPECLERMRQSKQSSFTMGWCPVCQSSYKVYGRQAVCPICKGKKPIPIQDTTVTVSKSVPQPTIHSTQTARAASTTTQIPEPRRLTEKDAKPLIRLIRKLIG